MKTREDHVRGLRGLGSRTNIILLAIETNQRAKSTTFPCILLLLKDSSQYMAPHLFPAMVESRNYQGGNEEPRIQQRILMIGPYSHNQVENQSHELKGYHKMGEEVHSQKNAKIKLSNM